MWVNKIQTGKNPQIQSNFKKQNVPNKPKPKQIKHTKQT
jgi:hypothetical protein